MSNVLIGVVAVLVLQFVTSAAASCDAKCTTSPGNCQSNGRCLCWWGWTGPNAKFIMSGLHKNRILADYCMTPCHYTQDYLNGNCASIPTASPRPTPQSCSVPVNKTVPPIPCDSQCGTGRYYGLGRCLSNGRCLCWWGWTGSNACYVDGRTYNNRIIADSCTKPCHYTHDYRNLNCSSSSPTPSPTTQPPSTGNPTTTTGRPSTGQPSTGPPTTKQPSTSSATTGYSSTAKPTTGKPITSSAPPKTKQCWKVHDRAHLLFCVHTLCMSNITKTFLLVSSLVSSKQLLCFVHGQGQKREQKPRTKNFVEFHNHSPPLTTLRLTPFS